MRIADPVYFAPHFKLNLPLVKTEGRAYFSTTYALKTKVENIRTLTYSSGNHASHPPHTLSLSAHWLA
jgi:hypothetical protein